RARGPTPERGPAPPGEPRRPGQGRRRRRGLPGDGRLARGRLDRRAGGGAPPRQDDGEDDADHDEPHDEPHDDRDDELHGGRGYRTAWGSGTTTGAPAPPGGA